MTELLFIRHGATAGNLEKRYIGRTDEALCETGLEQVKQLADRNIHADKVIVSPMKRTVQTAEIVFPGKSLLVIDELRETDFGSFEGHTADELSNDAEYRAWVDGWCRGPIPDGESTADFKRRCINAFAELSHSFSPEETLALVVHGGVIMSILEYYAFPHKDFYAYHIPNAGVICAAWDGKNLILTNSGS